MTRAPLHLFTNIPGGGADGARGAAPPVPPLLRLEGLGVARGGRAVLEGIDLEIRQGEFVGLIGRNGAGKTTMLRAALGLLPAAGHSTLAALDRRARARLAAWLPQDRAIAWPVSVEALVALGRSPHGGPAATTGDRAAIERALARMDLEPLRHRPATALSGGEQARVLIARAIAQETPLLLADEPAAGLDPASQIALMALFAAMAAEGRAVLASMHDLGLAVRHCTRLVVLDRGRLVADGPPGAVLTPGLLAQVFQITAHFTTTPAGPVFQPLEVVR